MAHLRAPVLPDIESLNIRAEQCRLLAHGYRAAEQRKTLLLLAADFEKLALVVKQLDPRASSKKPNKLNR